MLVYFHLSDQDDFLIDLMIEYVPVRRSQLEWYFSDKDKKLIEQHLNDKDKSLIMLDRYPTIEAQVINYNTPIQSSVFSVIYHNLFSTIHRAR